MRIPRLFVEVPLSEGQRVPLEPARATYLRTVLRRRIGDPVHVFNGLDGEWAARLVEAGRRDVALIIGERTRAQAHEPGVTLALAPIRRSRLDWLIEKAVELGVGRVRPVLTERAVARLENPERLRAIAIEAAEQSGRLTVPPIESTVPLHVWLDEAVLEGRVLMADEVLDGLPLQRAPAASTLLIGPEGGFTPSERAMLRDDPAVVPVRLGPLVLRAETAAVAGLAGIIQARDTSPLEGDETA